jgi:hypothetical protein
MRPSIACALSLLLCSHAHAQHRAEAGTRYLTEPVPEAWGPTPLSPSRLKLEDVLRPARPPRTVAAFVARFGAPDLYLAPEHEVPGYGGRLVYRLQTGHTVTLHVGRPPLQSIGAIAVRDKDGKEIRLIK